VQKSKYSKIEKIEKIEKGQPINSKIEDIPKCKN
jgi:hypothetical protein